MSVVQNRMLDSLRDLPGKVLKSRKHCHKIVVKLPVRADSVLPLNVTHLRLAWRKSLRANHLELLRCTRSKAGLDVFCRTFVEFVVRFLCRIIGFPSLLRSASERLVELPLRLDLRSLLIARHGFRE